MKKIQSYKTCLIKRLDKRWEWECAIWIASSASSPFDFFADAVVKSVEVFDTQEECNKNMLMIMKGLGVTKKTHKAL